jgi:hypothetical protein
MAHEPGNESPSIPREVFLSYAREDFERAQVLVRVFEEAGWSVWWDQEALRVGDLFPKEIEDILLAAKCVVVLWSRASLKSAWVRIESAEGANRGVLAPARMDGVTPPLQFRLLNTADLNDWEGEATHPELQKLLDAIARLLDRERPRPSRNLYLRPSLTARVWRAGAAMLAGSQM